jgi:hypothetical protein
MIALGAVAGLLGVTAVLLRQPYHVWFVLLLSAALFVGILVPRLKQFERQFAEYELRRMQAADSL